MLRQKMTDKLEVINVEAKYAAIDEVVETGSNIKSHIFEQEAVELYVEDLIADGKPIPGVGLVKNIKPIVKIINTQDNS